MEFQNKQSLFSRNGERKYLNQEERKQFLQGTQNLPFARKLFCQLLYYTGARITEIYDIKTIQIDFSDKVVLIRTLKRRRDDIYRQIPIPELLLSELKKFVTSKCIVNEDENIWPFSKRTGLRTVKKIMRSNNIQGIKACALGLRHGFAVHAVSKVPQTQVQKWMGHAYITTTALYLNVSGVEERQWAKRLWDEI